MSWDMTGDDNSTFPGRAQGAVTTRGASHTPATGRVTRLGVACGHYAPQPRELTGTSKHVSG